MDSTKYDRQIRLFGEELQKTICNLKVQVLGASNAVSMEIIKNLVLLGVGEITVNLEMITEVEKYIPNTLQEINENLKVNYSTEIGKSDFLFLIDNEVSEQSQPFYFVCSKCCTIQLSKCEHVCKCEQNDTFVAKQCLIGAYSVQEFLKMLQDKPHAKSYSFSF